MKLGESVQQCALSARRVLYDLDFPADPQYEYRANARPNQAKVDGASDWDIFSRIVAPLAKPILIVIFIITFVGLYNEFILAQILIRDVNQFTYATGLNLFIESEYSAKWGQMAAAAIIGSIPIVVLFLVMQDRIVPGLQGAVKG